MITLMEMFKPSVRITPSNDFEARIMGRLAVKQFLNDFGPGRTGEGLSRLRIFFRDNPGVIITSDDLHKIGGGSTETDRRRRELFKQGYNTISFTHDKSLNHKEYRIVGYDPNAINTLHKCSQNVRAAVIKRANGRCQNKCGYVFGTIHPYSEKIEYPQIHRIVPGSLYTIEGCLALCVSCNNGLSDMIITEKSQCEILLELLKKSNCDI